MLGASEILHGLGLALGSTNATAGAVAYQLAAHSHEWAMRLWSGGEFDLLQAEFYQGYARRSKVSGRTSALMWRMLTPSRMGPLPFGDHVLDRFNGRRADSSALGPRPIFSRAIRINSSAGPISIRRSIQTKRRTFRRCFYRSTTAPYCRGTTSLRSARTTGGTRTITRSTGSRRSDRFTLFNIRRGSQGAAGARAVHDRALRFQYPCRSHC